MQEKFKDIPGYEGLYQVSDLGNVKSVERYVKSSRNSNRFIRERILKPRVNKYGYYQILLSKDGITVTRTIHQLVAISFLNHTLRGLEIVVDHINNNPLDNRLENLQLITHRENASKDQKNRTSKYIGVCWHKRDKKWRASIHENGKVKYIGNFTNELDASEAYQRVLKNI